MPRRIVGNVVHGAVAGVVTPVAEAAGNDIPAAGSCERVTKLKKEWTEGNIITLKNVSTGRNMRLKENLVDGNGGDGEWSQFEVQHVGADKIKLKGVGSGNYIRMGPLHVDHGPGGVNCEFYVVKHKEKMNGEKVYSLEGVQHPGCYIGFRNGGGVKAPNATGLGNHGSFSVCVVQGTDGKEKKEKKDKKDKKEKKEKKEKKDKD